MAAFPCALGVSRRLTALALINGCRERYGESLFHPARAGRRRDDLVCWVAWSKGTDKILTGDEVEVAVDGKHLGF